MYIFTVDTTKKEYDKYNGKECWATNKSIREDGYVEVYVPSFSEYILLRPNELKD